MRVVEGVEHLVGGRSRAPVVHVVRQIVQVEEIGQVVVDDAQLCVARVGIAH